MFENGWHSTTTRVRYKDTDRMGVVYYGNYLTFFEVGRAELMREIGFPYSELETKGYNLVVTETAAKYHGNTGYDSLVTIKTAITKLKNVRVRFDYKVMSAEDKLLVSGHTVHGCLNSNLKPSKFPDDIKRIMEKNVLSI
ncbi:acyl-CoA thioesterase [Thermodesulfobacteriota bacterium]